MKSDALKSSKFSHYKTPNASLSSIFQSHSIISSTHPSDQSLARLLDKLDKHDSVTRLKSLNGIIHLFKEEKLHNYQVEKFVFVFNKLAIVEPDLLARIALAEVLEQYFLFVKKSFQPHLKSIYHLIKSSTYDDNERASNAYKVAISKLGDEKVLNNIYNYVKSSLPLSIKLTISKPYVDYIKKWEKSFGNPPDQLEKCYSRLISSVLNFIANDINLSDFVSVWLEIRDLIWDFIGFSLFKNNNPYNIRIAASMLIDKAIQSTLSLSDVLPTNTNVVHKLLDIFYNSENEFIATRCVQLFIRFINISEMDEIKPLDIKHIIKCILLENASRKVVDDRFKNKELCITLSKLVTSNNDYFKEIVPQIITQLQDPESLLQLIEHCSVSNDIVKLLIEKISTILKSERAEQSNLLGTLTNIIDNININGILPPDSLSQLDYSKLMPFIPYILKLKIKFNHSIDDFIEFITLQMIPSLIDDRSKFGNIQVNKINNAIDVFEKCKKYIPKNKFGETNSVTFAPLSLNSPIASPGLDNRINLDVKLANSYFHHIYFIGIKINIVTGNFDISDEINNFWTNCLKYFMGMINLQLVQIGPQLSINVKPFLKAFITHKDLISNDISVIEAFDSCYKKGNYEIASIMSQNSTTHLLCLKAGYPPDVPLSHYISEESIESLLLHAITTFEHNVSISIICNHLPLLYINSLYKVIFVDGFYRFSYEQLLQIPKLITIIPFDSFGDDQLNDKLKQLTNLTIVIDPNLDNFQPNGDFIMKFLMKIDLGDDIHAIFNRFENYQSKYSGFPILSKYITDKLSADNSNLSRIYEKTLIHDEACNDLSEKLFPNNLKWLIPLTILEKIDTPVTLSPNRFKYCLGKFLDAINETSDNSTYFMFKFCKKFITQLDEMDDNIKSSLNKLKMSSSDYISEFSQIILLVSPEELDYDTRCFILSLFYSVKVLENVKFVNELNEYLEFILPSIHPAYLDILIGSKDSSVISIAIQLFNKLVKLQSFKSIFEIKNFDSELDADDIYAQSCNFDETRFKRSSEYQYELESIYPNLFGILLGYIESTPSNYISVWKILIESEMNTSFFPNCDQLDVFINEIITMHNNRLADVSKLKVGIFKKFPQYILNRVDDDDDIRDFFNDISAELIKKEVELMNKWKITASHKNLTITGLFKTENMQTINFKIHLNDYPFEEAIFNLNKGEIHGISKKQSLSWLSSSRDLLKLGKIALAVKNIKENITQFYKGVSECNICLAAFHTETKTLANKKCNVCKNAFHSCCLLRWFRTSHKPKCPICQSHTAIAFPMHSNRNDKS